MPLHINTAGGTGTGSGNARAILWDADEATDASIGRYATMAEVAAVVEAVESPVRVKLKGAISFDDVGTHEWAHVTIESNRTSAAGTTAAIFAEGVIVRNVRWEAAIDVSTSATTTRGLEYTAGYNAYFEGANLSGNASVGLIRANHSGIFNAYFEGVTFNRNVLETTTTTTVNAYVKGGTFAGSSSGHVKGTTGTLNLRTDDQVTGTYDSAAFSGTENFYVTSNPTKIADVAVSGAPTTGQVLTATSSSAATWQDSTGVGAVRATPDANDLVCFNLNEVAGTTSLTSTGAGTAVTLATMSGTGDLVFGSQCPFGNGMAMIGQTYFEGVGAAKTYAPFVQDFTLQCWTKFISDPAGGAGLAGLVGKKNAGGASASYLLAVDTTTGEVNFEIGTAAGQVTGVSDFTLAKGEWSHIALTYDGANIKLYINGLLAKTAAQTGNMDFDATQSMLLGNAAAFGAGYILSTVWLSDVARSLVEIQSIYNTGAFNGAIGVLDAQSLNGVDIDPTPPVDGMVMTASGAGAAAWETPRLIRSNADMVAAFPTSGTNALDAEVGQIIGVMKPSDALGIRLRWRSASGTPTATVTLYDSGGAVLGTADQVVSTTPTTYDVLFASPVDLSGYLFEDLIVSVWEHNGGTPTGNYYSAITANFATQATPLPAGEGIETRGSIYVSPGGSVPTTTTGIEVYGVDLIRRFRLCLRSSK